ncbi:MAG: hypothetical protein DSY66_04745 [Persephonella sp.]|nr:MAG: hypothetical protein DSY53_02190 [Persephonella sp.]RUM60214.1 MAG: hypothetical protein DSY66_04745 [Persephonella sp.]
MNFRKHARSLDDTQHLIDMTALVDIAFIIILFLGIVSTLAPVSSIKVFLPEASSGTPKIEPAQVVIDKDGNYYVRGRQVSLDDIRYYLRNVNTKSMVIIADKRVEYGKVVKIIDLAKQMGIEEVNIATRD